MIGKTFNIQSNENILKAVREKCKSHTKENSHLKITSNFSVETLKARRAWKNVFQVLKDYDGQPRLIYSAKLFVIIE